MTATDTAPIRLGVVGLGAVAQAVHLPLIALRPELFTLAAVADLSDELCSVMGARFGVPAPRQFRTLDEMIQAGGVDAVMILSRGSHAAYVLAAFEAGLPVFCEKPLAFTAAEVDELREHEPDLGHPAILLGYMKQYDPAVVAARRILAEIDDIRSVDVTVLHPTGASQLEFARIVGPTTPLDPAFQTASDEDDRRLATAALGENYDESLWRAYRGSLVSSLAHDLSVMRSLGTIPATVDHADIWRQSSRFAVRDVGRDRRSFGDHPASISATGRLEKGGRYSLAWHYLPDFPAYRETVRVVHGRGSLELVFPSPYLMHAPTELRVTSLDGDAEKQSTRRSIVEAFEQQLVAFHDMIRHGTPPFSGLREGRDDIVLCEQIVANVVTDAGESVGGEIGRLVAAPIPA